MSGEKSGYSRWDLKSLLGEIGFQNAEQKNNSYRNKNGRKAAGSNDGSAPRTKKIKKKGKKRKK